MTAYFFFFLNSYILYSCDCFRVLRARANKNKNMYYPFVNTRYFYSIILYTRVPEGNDFLARRKIRVVFIVVVVVVVVVFRFLLGIIKQVLQYALQLCMLISNAFYFIYYHYSCVISRMKYIITGGLEMRRIFSRSNYTPALLIQFFVLE